MTVIGASSIAKCLKKGTATHQRRLLQRSENIYILHSILKKDENNRRKPDVRAMGRRRTTKRRMSFLVENLTKHTSFKDRFWNRKRSYIDRSIYGQRVVILVIRTYEIILNWTLRCAGENKCTSSGVIHFIIRQFYNLKFNRIKKPSSTT